ncbi:hypothetical protein C8F04DRAFT_1233190 [Mycena alexandri]|uniref:Uncharacterized protein n=1 Tax=Mycena alexandri TaxID=1745969 RepID=A0AAD6X2F6_9AGAR|nr:hypothetical protein C8F04DRAFT_1233190 [Mycena alexandri]
MPNATPAKTANAISSTAHARCLASSYATTATAQRARQRRLPPNIFFPNTTLRYAIYISPSLSSSFALSFSLNISPSASTLRIPATWEISDLEPRLHAGNRYLPCPENQIYVAARDMREMELLMTVCPQWGPAVEYHQLALTLFDPLGAYAYLGWPPLHNTRTPTHLDSHSQSSHNSSSSKAQRLSPYLHLRTLLVLVHACLPCRINAPLSSFLARARQRIPASRHIHAPLRRYPALQRPLRAAGKPVVRRVSARRELGRAVRGDNVKRARGDLDRAEALVRARGPRTRAATPRRICSRARSTLKRTVAMVLQIAGGRGRLRKHTRWGELLGQAVAAKRWSGEAPAAADHGRVAGGGGGGDDRPDYTGHAEVVVVFVTSEDRAREREQRRANSVDYSRRRLRNDTAAFANNATDAASPTDFLHVLHHSNQIDIDSSRRPYVHSPPRSSFVLGTLVPLYLSHFSFHEHARERNLSSRVFRVGF